MNGVSMTRVTTFKEKSRFHHIYALMKNLVMREKIEVFTPLHLILKPI